MPLPSTATTSNGSSTPPTDALGVATRVRSPERLQRRGTRLSILLAGLLVTATLASLDAQPPDAAERARSVADSRSTVYLPRLERDVGSWPDQALADRIWGALEAFERRHPLETLVPSVDVTPSIAAAVVNVDAACADFPDIPDVFGPGAHRSACRVWVPDAFGLYHAARALRLVQAGRPMTDTDVMRHHDWAQAYLAESVRVMQLFVFVRCDPPNPFGSDDPPRCFGYRDTRAAVWQNTQRAMEIGVLADAVAQTGGIHPDTAGPLDDVLVSSARAWRAAFWSAQRMPNARLDFVTRSAVEAPARSLGDEDVAAVVSHTFRWDADKRNSPAEEMAWMGAGVVVAMAVAGDRIAADEKDDLVAAGRHYVDYSLAFNRPDPVFGVPVRTVGAETDGGPYGQNRYWIENHQDDAPSLPYLGFTWASIGIAQLTSDLPQGAVWPSFAPRDAWPVLAASAEATLIMPDGQSLADLRPGNGVGFDVARYPLWTMPCGEHRAGALYIDVGPSRPAGSARFVSEIGHPAGLSIVLAGVPLIRTALAAGDLSTAARWQRRVDAVLAEYTANPPGFDGVPCKVAPWVSTTPAYHWAYMINAYLYPWLVASGHRIGERDDAVPTSGD